jgi:hypothetical protein
MLLKWHILWFIVLFLVKTKFWNNGSASIIRYESELTQQLSPLDGAKFYPTWWTQQITLLSHNWWQEQSLASKTVFLSKSKTKEEVQNICQFNSNVSEKHATFIFRAEVRKEVRKMIALSRQSSLSEPPSNPI